MAFTITNTIVLGTSQTGLTLVPSLIDTAGAPLGGMTTTGAYEVGMGNYLYTHEVPDATRGAIVYKVGSVVMAVADVNPEVAGAPLTAAGVWAYSPRTVTTYGTLVADVTTAVWAAGTRTLSSYGTLAADVWAVGTRSLTTYGTLVADIWGNSTRTLSTYGTLVADVTTAVWAAGTRSLTTTGTLVADTATAVWAAGTRSLTTYGTLVADVWGYATRGLTTYGTLVSDVWANSTRTLTGMGTLAADAATAVWASVSRTLTGFGTLAADVSTAVTSAHGAGSYVDTGGGGGGSGANSVTITLHDDLAAPIAGQRVTVKNSAQTAVIAGPVTTNVNGEAAFNLDSATYAVLVSSTAGYTPIAAQSLVVSGTTTASYTTARVSQQTPITPSTCLVYGTLVRITGAPAVGVQITFSLPSTKGAEAGTTELIEVAQTETVLTDSSGYFSIPLLWSSAIVPYASGDLKTYLVSCPAAKLTAHVTIPDQANLDLSSAFPPVD